MEISTPAVGTAVHGRDGAIGTVAAPPRSAADVHEEYLPVQLTRLLGLVRTTRLVPAAWIRAARSDATLVTLDATRAQVAGCPPPRTDADVRADVVEALSETGGFFQVPVVRATVAAGVVGLTGHFPSARMQRATVARVRAIRGVLAVDDRSTEDSALANAVAQALAHDADSRTAYLRVSSRLGAIHLSGDLPSEAARARAAAIALAVPGVARVHNDTAIPRSPTAWGAGWQLSDDDR